MIIAAYPGAGKTTFAKQIPEAVDLPVMPYKRLLPPDWKTNPEAEVDEPYYLSNPLFPDNYIADILRAEREYRYVLIPTDFDVISRLQGMYKRKVLIFYPEDDCREEYRARFLTRSNAKTFLALFGHRWNIYFDPVYEYSRCDEKGGVFLPMGAGTYLTDLRQRIDEELQSDAPPVDDASIQEIEEEMADMKKRLLLFLPWEDEPCLYSIDAFDSPEEQAFLREISRAAFDLNADLSPHIALKGGSGKGALEEYSTRDRERVRAYVKKHAGKGPLWPDEWDEAPNEARTAAANRREQLIYHRDYEPDNYPWTEILYFSRMPIGTVRQLVAEGLLDPQARHNDSPTVQDMLDFCSGADEDIWFFHGFTVSPKRGDSRVTLEGFESFTSPTPERTEEFLRFNRRGETEVSEDGACWCWYD